MEKKAGRQEGRRASMDGWNLRSASRKGKSDIDRKRLSYWKKSPSSHSSIRVHEREREGGGGAKERGRQERQWLLRASSDGGGDSIEIHYLRRRIGSQQDSFLAEQKESEIGKFPGCRKSRYPKSSIQPRSTHEHNTR